MKIIEKFVPESKGRAVYVRVAHPDGKGTPLLVCHGGPGSTHNSLELLDPLSQTTDRPIFYYDQFGCGLSSIKENPNAYSPIDWVEELDYVRRYFKLNRLFLLGHSWGGMLMQLYLREKGQDGIAGIVLSSTLCSSKQWSIETHKLTKFLSQEDQEAIKRAEESGDYSSKSFSLASENYLKLTVSDIDYDDISIPECLSRKKRTGKESYLHCWGPSEFTPLGLLKDYDTTSFLPTVSCPALILYGSKDESNEVQNQTMYSLSGTNDKVLHCFQGSRHMTYFESNQEYLDVLGAWLKVHR